MAGETVLIVEDRRENIVHIAHNVLKPNGYEVITAMDGERGLKRILMDAPDLVILDLNMPKMDGLEVLSALRERQIDIPVILTTFYGSEQVARQALRLGAVDYVVKPYDVDDMVTAVQKALAHRRPPSTRRHDLPEERMPLTRQVERWMRDMNILNRVGKELVALLDLDLICTRTVEAAIYITRADYGFLFLRGGGHEPGQYLSAARGPQDQRAVLVDQPVMSDLARHVAQSGETMLRANTPGDVSLFEFVGKALGPVAATPIRRQRDVVGVLVVARSHGEAVFREADAEWLSGLADYAAIAVRNARTLAYRAQPHSSPWRESTLSDCQRELAQLTAELQAATETAQRLAALLAGED
jgi:two-component system NtrC family sensor kinase